MSTATRTILRRVAQTVLAGVILGIGPSVYDAVRFLSRAHAFEQMSIGLSEEATRKIMMKEDIRCGVSLLKEDVCRFSDFWRHYEVRVDSSTKRISSLAYYRRKRPSVLQRLFGRGY